MADLVELAAELPELHLAPGEVLIAEGTRTGSMWILLSGTVRVTKNGVLINTIDRPGAAFGEIAVLRGGDHSATVTAADACRFGYARDGRAFLTGHGELLFLVAAGLAERLDIVTGYLADLRNQYTDAPGIAMVSNVLGRLVQASGTPRPQPGSAREPDPEY